LPVVVTSYPSPVKKAEVLFAAPATPLPFNTATSNLLRSSVELCIVGVAFGVGEACFPVTDACGVTSLVTTGIVVGVAWRVGIIGDEAFLLLAPKTYKPISTTSTKNARANITPILLGLLDCVSNSSLI